MLKTEKIKIILLIIYKIILMLSLKEPTNFITIVKKKLDCSNGTYILKII